MVMGSGPLGQFWRRELENEFRRFHDRLTFVWSDDLSLQEILRRCASLPEHSAILYVIVRHRRGRGGVCGRASVRRPSRHGQCPPVCGAERLPGRRNRRRIADVHRRPQSRHGRRGRSTVERRAAEQHQRAAATAQGNRHSTGASSSGGASPRAGCRQGVSCAIALRACGAHTGARCSAPSACWPSNRS